MTDSLPVPSKGIFYERDKYDNPLEYLEVGYLTTEDEIILCTPNLFHRGEALYRVLERKIEPYNNIKLDDLLVNDKETILLWLRESAFGNMIDYIDKDNKRFNFNTHNIAIKNLIHEPDSNGYYSFNVDNMDFKMKLLTVLDERKYKTKFNRINYLAASIVEINGEEYNFQEKKEFLMNSSISTGRKIRNLIDGFNFGVDRKTIYTYDGKEYKTEITMDELFFGVSKDNLSKNSTAINDSIFFLLNEGQGYINSDILAMPTHIRLYNIDKLSEKIKKHNDEINKNNKR